MVEQSGLIPGSDNLIGIQPFEANQPAFVDDALELACRIQKPVYRIPILDLFGNDPVSAQGGKRALHSHPRPGGFRQEQIAAVVEIGPLVEMALIAACEKVVSAFLHVRPVFAGRKPILLMHHRKDG